MDETHLQNLPNVTDMNNLHEAPLLHLLRRRLEDQIIYTWAGAVLISVNPYSQLEIYGAEHLAKQKAAADGGGDDVPPHIYAVARHAISRSSAPPQARRATASARRRRRATRATTRS